TRWNPIVSWQKQKQEKENKFLQATQAELDEHVRALRLIGLLTRMRVETLTDGQQANRDRGAFPGNVSHTHICVKFSVCVLSGRLLCLSCSLSGCRDEMYQDLLTKYAIIEDKQRAVIANIVEKQKALVTLAVRRHQQVIELGQEVEDGQLEGMSQVKQACKDFVEIKDTLLSI
ncbi:hypothetical protein HYDPIDRAFT_117151, partial [Hydnomerulius pinastri MD-312]